MAKATTGIIPMNGAIRDFDNHLKSHPRTILSAKYGDGKSFFLKAAEKKLGKKYVFLKLYPVNYQVEENQGVFEYIKRDLLFQLYGNGMVPSTFEIPDNIASYFFLRHKWEDFAKEILQYLSFLDASNTVKTTIGAIKFLMAMREKYEEYKANKSTVGTLLNDFLSVYDKKGIYEADPITSILCGIISAWKHANPKQKICLIFEDMDRIDPAHIFRILNVVSAHMDYGYKYGVSPGDNSLSGNKFGVDNIVICLDYDNLHSIYRHFYGPDACFEGYISKFSDNGYFQYSIKRLARQFYSERLRTVTEMDTVGIKAVLKHIDLLSFSLRQIFQSIDDVDKQIHMPESEDCIKFHKGMITMAALFKRMGMDEEGIVSSLAAAFVSNPLDIGPYMGTLMMHRRKLDEYPFDFTFGEKQDNIVIAYRILNCNDKGKASICKKSVAGSSAVLIDPKEEAEYLLKYIYR